MKVVHLSVFRKLLAGQRKQLKFEAGAAKLLTGDTWDTIALHTDAPVEGFERRIPFLFRPLFLRTFYAWLLMLKLSRQYDVVLCRHMTFDPFALLFSWFIRNRVSVHHAKEIEELLLIRAGLPGRLASWLERHAGTVAVRTAMAVIGVTEDIRRYELMVRRADKPSHVYPNGIFFHSTQVAPDHRSANTVNAVFICDSFASWHGLDLLIDAVHAHPDFSLEHKLNIHLIGSLTDAQDEQIQATNRIHNTFVIHGQMQAQDYAPIMSLCDIGIGSLALFRKDLQEAATLKVREYLAMGLPVFSGHKDTAIPDDFKFYRHGDCSIDEMLRFGYAAKSVSRQTVRTHSQPFVDKTIILRNTVDWLADVPATATHAMQTGP